MTILQNLAEKELQGVPFDATEIAFLKSILFSNEECGQPEFNGWYVDLFFDPYDAETSDYIVADVHTQPTDEVGGIVGNVLHVGTGKVNLGVFLASAPSFDFEPMAFVGPVMSYYEKTTTNFNRLTDKQWTTIVENNQLPARPDWVNIYLADKSGKARSAGRELPAQVYVGTIEEPAQKNHIPQYFALYPNYPNPFNAQTIICFDLPTASPIEIVVYDLTGQLVNTIVTEYKSAGSYQYIWNASGLPSGVYLCQIRAGSFRQTQKLLLLK